jgi:phosphoglycolate phosphatase-like HAD superfamily hydrolase
LTVNERENAIALTLRSWLLRFLAPSAELIAVSGNGDKSMRCIFEKLGLTSIFTQEGASYEVIFVDGLSIPEILAAAEPFRERRAHFTAEAVAQLRQAFSTSRRATDWRGWKPSKSSRKE